MTGVLVPCRRLMGFAILLFTGMGIFFASATASAGIPACPRTAEQLASLMTTGDALPGLRQTEAQVAVSSLEPGHEYCAGYLATWEFSEEAPSGQLDADPLRKHTEDILAYPSAAAASDALKQIADAASSATASAAATAQSFGLFIHIETLDVGILGDERVVVRTTSGIERDVPETEEATTVEYAFLFRRGPVLVASGDRFSAGRTSLEVALQFAEQVDARVAVAVQ